MDSISSTRRGHLRSVANSIKATITVGKEGLNDKVLAAIDTELKAKELIKIKVLKNAPGDLDGIANEIAGKLECHVVQTIGRVAVLYRESDEHPSTEYLV